ncbi:hypothetical protein JAAARDRAFT_354819 [Jaapia argillacea MUCL 33604]|uniref:Uncharacterized protein n=1 Tax=Jaapia argillacea MUCL 33604 TaxID=933084 RepID=A0A067PX92_9AGAM|nr:hypothetical protein JAAARDRAFT_354819 [Jaapia argillacea MUCL 33604]
MSGKRELISSHEAWDERTDQFAFTVILWREEGHLYYLRHQNRIFDLQSLVAEPIDPRDYYRSRILRSWRLPRLYLEIPITKAPVCAVSTRT